MKMNQYKAPGETNHLIKTCLRMTGFICRTVIRKLTHFCADGLLILLKASTTYSFLGIFFCLNLEDILRTFVDILFTLFPYRVHGKHLK